MSDREVYRRLATMANFAEDGVTDPAEMRARARTWVRELRAWADRVEQAMPPDWREGDVDADASGARGVPRRAVVARRARRRPA